MNPRNRGLGGHSPQPVQALLDQGLTQRALAERVGVTHQAVSRFVRRHSLLCLGRQAYRSSQSHQVAERRRQVQQLLQGGLTSAQVAAHLGISSATVSLDRRTLGVGRACKGAEGRTLRGLGRAQVQACLRAISRAQLALELGGEQLDGLPILPTRRPLCSTGPEPRRWRLFYRSGPKGLEHKQDAARSAPEGMLSECEALAPSAIAGR